MHAPASKTMVPATDKDAIRERLLELGREANRLHSDPQGAIDSMLSVVVHDEELASQLVRPGVAEVIYQTRYTEKHRVKNAPNVPGFDYAATVAAGETVRLSLLDSWGMPDGRMLGDWTGAELEQQAKAETSIASGYLLNASFYRAVARKAGNRTVRAAVKPRELDELLRKAKGKTK